MRDDVDELKGQTLRSSQDLVEPPGREDSEDDDSTVRDYRSELQEETKSQDSRDVRSHTPEGQPASHHRDLWQATQEPRLRRKKEREDKRAAQFLKDGILRKSSEWNGPDTDDETDEESAEESRSGVDGSESDEVSD